MAPFLWANHHTRLDYAVVSHADSDHIGGMAYVCLLYTSDAADELLCVDLGGRRIIKKKKQIKYFNMEVQ